MEKSSKNYISLFGGKPARGLLKPPPTPPRREFTESTRGKCASVRRGRECPGAELGRGESGRGGK
jgi:hypothetical protein